MPNTTTYRFGDVVLVPFPFTDQTETKKRPAVVASSDRYNNARSDVILMAITSQSSGHSRIGEVVIEDWKGAGLIKASIVKPILTTLEKRLIIRPLGKLGEKDITALKDALMIILG